MRTESSLFLWPDWRLATHEEEPQEEGYRLTPGPRTYGMSIEQIGDALGITSQCASYRIRQALRKVIRLMSNA